MKREAYQDQQTASSRKDPFLDDTILIGYDGTNMPYVMFYNQIINLMARCPYPDIKLILLRSSCVHTAAQNIAMVISTHLVLIMELKSALAYVASVRDLGDPEDV